MLFARNYRLMVTVTPLSGLLRGVALVAILVAEPGYAGVVASGATMQARLADQTASAPAGTGAISGSVKTRAGVPLADVYVTVARQGCAAGLAWVGSVTTNASGAFATTANLAPGTYYAYTTNAFRRGYIDSTYGGRKCVGPCNPDLPEEAGTPVVVGSATVAGVDIVVDVGGGFSGSLPGSGVIHVADSSGRVVAFFNGRSGQYVVTGLATGTYYAVGRPGDLYSLPRVYGGPTCPYGADGGGCAVTSGTPISVVAGVTTPGVDFSGFEQGGLIGGTLRGPSGILTWQAVSVYDSQNRPAGSAFSYASGGYSAGPYPAGQYYVHTTTRWYDGPPTLIDEMYPDAPCSAFGAVSYGPCAGAALVTVTAGQTTTGIDVTLGSGGRIGGPLTTGASPSSADFGVFDADGRPWEYFASSAPGSYETPLLPAGDFFVVAWPNGGEIDQVNGQDCAPCLVNDKPVGAPVGVRGRHDQPRLLADQGLADQGGRSRCRDGQAPGRLHPRRPVGIG